ncbi:hypothetical protein SLS62_003166 [Diatrype stigma]|uniref:Helicase ATP-binding domain-containing protein n=1 Tax=Diatrype stigma TaxID=117547 RepID=A0AAN9UX74_9PEZI
MDSNTTPGAGAPDPGLPPLEQASEPAPTLHDPAQRPNGAAAPTANDNLHLKRHIRPKTSGTKSTPYWKGLINKELETLNKRASEEGPWDPDTYLRTEQDNINFYAGHRVRPGILRDQMNVARWNIENSLKDDPPRIDEGIERSQSPVSRVEAADKSKEILQAVKSEGQREIDAEDANAGDQKSELDERAINTAAQTLISASPHSLGPPIEPCAKYLRMEKCGEYGRDKLTIWRSPLFPRVNDEDGSKSGFLDQQVTSIVWILQRFLGELPRLKVEDFDSEDYLPDTAEDKANRKKLRGPKYFGGILADSMGLGKTLSCIACLELMAAKGLNVIPGGKGPNGKRFKRKHHPMVILAPNATVAAQWIEEICRNTDHDSISQIITSGNGLQKKHPSGRVRPLTAEEFGSEKWPEDVRYVWNESEKRAAKTIIIMSIDTFASRTLESSNDEAGQAKYESIFTKHKRKISVLIVDEAHKVKNDATRNWKSVALLDRRFTLLVTATPTINSLTDLMALARLLWDRPSEYLKAHNPDVWRTMEENITNLQALSQLDTVEAWDDLRLAAGRPGLLAKMLCRNKGAHHDIQLVRDYLKYFESLAVLRRSPTSNLYYDWEKTKPVSLEGLFPPVNYKTVDIQLEPENKFGTMSMHITTMRHARVDFPRLVQFMLEQDDPSPKTALDFVKIAIRRSPVLRYILYYINENIIDKGPEEKIRKLLITEASPILAYYYELVLRFLGFNCRTFHADLSQEARKDLVADFNSDKDKTCQILIQMYTVGFAGSNLHKNCSRVLVASQATSLAIQWQAIHRVIRVGQMSDVQVHRIMVKNSYHSFRESRQVEKLLPELASRAQGPMNDVLVDILNLFQEEIDILWKSPESLKLVSEKNLLLNEWKDVSTDNQDDTDTKQASKRQKMEDGSFLPANSMTAASVEAPSTPSRSSPHNNPQLKVERGSAGWFCNNSDENDNDNGSDETEFLAMMTRNDFYSEFKELPKLAKSHFDHEKNMLRRSLSYGTPGGNATKRIWTAQDLKNPAVLERAMELMIRIRLSARPIMILPLPQINFALAPIEERIALQKQLAKVTHTEQDVEVTRQQLESPKKGGIKETLPGETSIDASCSEIERALNENSRLSGGKPKGFMEDPDDDVDMEDIPAFAEGKDEDGLEDNEPEQNEPEQNEPEQNEPEGDIPDNTLTKNGLDLDIHQQEDKDQTENSGGNVPEKSEGTENDPKENGQRAKNGEGGVEVNGPEKSAEMQEQAAALNDGKACGNESP